MALLLLVRDVIRYERMVDAVTYFETRATYNTKILLHGKRDCRKLLLMKSNNGGEGEGEVSFYFIATMSFFDALIVWWINFFYASSFPSDL